MGYDTERHASRDLPGLSVRDILPKDGNSLPSLDEPNEHINALISVLRGVFGDTVAFDGGIEATARRVLGYWQEYSPLSGRPENGGGVDFEFTTFKATGKQLVVVPDIEFTSLCQHHLLPFYGIAHIGYLPHATMVGLSKIPRLVGFMAKRPQVQETLSSDIAAFMEVQLAPMGVAVVLQGRHTCMSCRGVAQHNASMTTSVMQGIFRTSEAIRMEFLQYISGRRI